MNNSDVCLLTVYVTVDQENAIRQLFLQREWHYMKVSETLARVIQDMAPKAYLVERTETSPRFNLQFKDEKDIFLDGTTNEESCDNGRSIVVHVGEERVAQIDTDGKDFPNLFFRKSDQSDSSVVDGGHISPEESLDDGNQRGKRTGRRKFPQILPVRRSTAGCRKNKVKMETKVRVAELKATESGTQKNSYHLRGRKMAETKQQVDEENEEISAAPAGEEEADWDDTEDGTGQGRSKDGVVVKAEVPDDIQAGDIQGDNMQADGISDSDGSTSKVKTESFVCTECNKSYCSRRNLQRHMDLHKDSEEHACPVCGKIFSLKRYMVDHVRLVHKSQMPHKCELCGKGFSKKYRLKRHQAIHSTEKSVSCQLCSRWFASDLLLKEHMNYHSRSQNSGETHSCKECGKDFSQARYMKDHQRLMHGDRERKFSCEKCGKLFLTGTALERHKIVHSDVRPFDCSVCSKSFKSIYRLNEHVSTVHSGKKKPKVLCETCGKSFKKRSSLMKHKALHVGEKEHHCDKCGKAFYRNDLLKVHMKIHSNDRPFSCEFCGKRFATRASFAKHRRENPNARCARPRGARQESEQKQVLEEEKIYQCEVCAKRFRLKRLLAEHKLRMHETNRPYHCNICSKSFPLRSILNQHRAIHSITDMHKCTVCDKQFTLKAYLVNHMIVHSNLKEFHCDACGQSFQYRQSLKRHSCPGVKTEEELTEKPYQCGLCSKRFKTEKYLHGHTLMHKGDRPFSCDICGKTFTMKEFLTHHQRLHRKHADKSTWTPSEMDNESTKSEIIEETNVSDESNGSADIASTTYELKYQCAYCNQLFQSIDETTEHQALHSGHELANL